MKVTATIQARMGSTRLPGKTLAPILGRPMLAWQIDRVRQCELIDEVVVATTERSADDVIVSLADELGVGCFRGSEDDVLGRVVAALRANAVELHVELSGDNPMPDMSIFDSVIGYFLDHVGELDYVTNALKSTYPAGVEVCVYPAEVLYSAEKLAIEPEEREHVDLAIWRNPDRFRIANLEAPPELHHPEMHFEVDTPEDLAVVSAVFEHFAEDPLGFNLQDAVDYLLANPNLIAANTGVERRWKEFVDK